MSTNNETHWIIAVPNTAASGTAARGRSTEEEARLTRRAHDMRTSRLADNFEFNIPKLKVGTLDTLMALSDDLAKVDTFVDGVLKKVKRAYIDNKGAESDLVVSYAPDEKAPREVTPPYYVEHWEWSIAKYPPVAPLKDLTTGIQQAVGSIDDDLRKRTSKLTEVTTAVITIERKETGSLLVKPLGPLIKPQDVFERDFITTLLVVVPRSKEEEFEHTYEILEDLAAQEKEAAAREDIRRRADVAPKEKKEAAKSQASDAASHGPNQPDKRLSAAEQAEEEARAVEQKMREEEEQKEREAEERRKAREKMCKNVVPRSLKKLVSDSEYTIYRIVVFKKGADTIKNLCRDKRYTVRQYEYNPEAEKSEQERKKQLTMDRDKQLSELMIWLKSKFSEVMTCWMHIKAIRTFTEAVLRYGIPVNFKAIIMRPKKGAHARLRQVLNELYSTLAGTNLMVTSEDQGADLVALSGGEFYPYVYLPLNLQDDV